MKIRFWFDTKHEINKEWGPGEMPGCDGCDGAAAVLGDRGGIPVQGVLRGKFLEGDADVV